MGSRALGALPRGVLVCAKYARNEQQDTDDAIADQKPDRAQFVFGQIKNNLAPKSKVAGPQYAGTRTRTHESCAVDPSPIEKGN